MLLDLICYYICDELKPSSILETTFFAVGEIKHGGEGGAEGSVCHGRGLGGRYGPLMPWKSNIHYTPHPLPYDDPPGVLHSADVHPPQVDFYQCERGQFCLDKSFCCLNHRPSLFPCPKVTKKEFIILTQQLLCEASIFFLSVAPLWRRVCGHARRLQRQGRRPDGQRDTLDQVPLTKQN